VAEEVEAASWLGLPVAYHDELELPFATHAAIGLPGQLQFHPVKYLAGLAAQIPGEGSFIAEHSRVVAVEEATPMCVKTEHGQRVLADDVIVATHLPILDEGLFFARTRPYRGYALAMEPGNAVPNGMFISASAPTHSLRTTTDDAGQQLLILAGEGHPVGESDDHSAHAQRLEGWGREQLGAMEVRRAWSTQDHFSLDHVPLIGRMHRGCEHLFTATGFGGWGMTGGTVAAMLLSDTILGTPNGWSELYAPDRLSVRSLPALARKGLHDARRQLSDRLHGGLDPQHIRTIPIGGGAIVDGGDGRLALHRSGEGELHALEAACTHLGCIVQWNDAERSWDCPCHGSRFAIDGAVLHGPALDPLKQAQLEH
jgi:nitrite reductase/ring-hydroxylating ferredoxin subunit